MNFCGSRILDLFIIYYTKWNNSTRANFCTALANIKISISMEHFEKFESQLNRKIQKERSNVQKTHENKLSRDKDKIKVRYKDITNTNFPENLRTKNYLNRNRRRFEKREPK